MVQGPLLWGFANILLTALFGHQFAEGVSSLSLHTGTRDDEGDAEAVSSMLALSAG